MQFLSDDFDFFSPKIGYQNFKHLKFHRFFIKKHYVFWWKNHGIWPKPSFEMRFTYFFRFQFFSNQLHSTQLPELRLEMQLFQLFGVEIQKSFTSRKRCNRYSWFLIHIPVSGAVSLVLLWKLIPLYLAFNFGQHQLYCAFVISFKTILNSFGICL